MQTSSLSFVSFSSLLLGWLALGAESLSWGGTLQLSSPLTLPTNNTTFVAPKATPFMQQPKFSGNLQVPASNNASPQRGPQVPLLLGSQSQGSGPSLQSSGVAQLKVATSQSAVQVMGPRYVTREVYLPVTVVDDQVVVHVQAGYFQVTLEVATKAGNGWKPVDTKHIDGSAQTVSFTAPAGVKASSMRTALTMQKKFPESQLGGPDTFVWSKGTPTVSQNGGLIGGANAFNVQPAININNGGVIFDRGDLAVGDLVANRVMMNLNLPAATIALASNNVMTGSSLTPVATSTLSTQTAVPAEAVESDIWKVIGNRLFFFNQYRGMQVFDLTDPSHPVKTGSVRMAAVGEQFYALDATGSYLALLSKNNTRKDGDGSTISLISVSTAGKAAVTAKLALEGSVAESRLIGSRLYVLLTVDKKAVVKGFDLSNPGLPANLGSVDVPGGCYLHLQAAASSLIVSSSNNGGWVDDDSGGKWCPDELNNLTVVSVAGDGAPHLVKTVQTKGFLADQFAMNVDGDTLTAVSQAWKGQPSGWGYGAVRQTWVETFSLSASGSAPLSQLRIEKAEGEVLHATRFDSKRLYVVTFHITDPLFIIDLQDPAHLKITGELQTPGWSAYIEPNGDRLMAVGVENWRVTVSWFDVTNPAAPQMLSRVYPGGNGGGNTWSEAIYDHKAVNWVKEEHKVFVPLKPNWCWNSNADTATQVVNIVNDQLSLGVVIQNEGTARRGTVINHALVSISGKEMVVTTNPATGDPKEIAWVELSWPVNRVIATGPYLLEFENGTSSTRSWYYSANPPDAAVIRLTSKNDPDTILDNVSLGAGSIIGMTEHEGSAFVLQWVSGDGASRAELCTWVLRPDANGKLQKVAGGSTSVTSWGQLDTANTQALWLNDQALVWHIPAQADIYGGGFYSRFPHATYVSRLAVLPQVLNLKLTKGPAVISDAIGTVTPATPAVADSDTTPSGNLCALEIPVTLGSDGSVSAGKAIEVMIPQDGGLQSMGRVFVENGFMFFSSERTNRYWNGFDSGLTYDMATTPKHGHLDPAHPGVTCSLHVVDFRDLRTPVVRDPVSLAGHLLGVSAVDKNGAYLITSRLGDLDADHSTAFQHFTALAYDGVRAVEVDNLDTAPWTAQASFGSEVFLAFSGSGDGTSTSSTIGDVRLDTMGHLHFQANEWALDAVPSSLKVVGTYLLASAYGDLEVAQFLGGSLQPRASLDMPNTLRYEVEWASPDVEASGLWIPAGDYGVDHFDFAH